MNVAIKTDIGRERTENEDRLLIDEKLGVFIVADGMGGHRAGKIASSLAAESAYDYIVKNFDYAKNNKEGFFTLLQLAFEKAHTSIKEQSIQNLRLKGMGTTLLVLIFVNKKGFIGHVGDSRAYIINENIIQVTTDHTVGEYLAVQKNIKPEKISTFSWHSLTQAVGESEKITPEIMELPMNQGDTLLLCSDGLTNMLSDKEIKKLVDINCNNLERMATKLVDAANNKGGKDNISLIIINY